MAEISTGRAKGLTPAFIQPDGTPGPSFLELKMRSLLLQALEYYRRRDTQSTQDLPAPLYPMFQMTSVYNDEEIAGASATVTVLGYWGTDLGREWRFTVEQEGGAWEVANIEIIEEDAGGGDAGSSAFWQLNPVASEFTVYDNGGYKLVVDFDQPTQDLEATFRIAYFRQDDGTLAYDQERSGVVEAGRSRLTLDSDWSGYDLAALGFQPGAHDVIAYIDDFQVESGELIVN